MIYVADSNIIISAIIHPSGTIGDLILRKFRPYELAALHYLLTEIQSKKSKILKATGYSEEEFLELLLIITKRIEFIDEEIIPDDVWSKAHEFAKAVDEKDTPYIALVLFTNIKLWTGDKKLIKGLRKKGFELVIDTEELTSLFN